MKKLKIVLAILVVLFVSQSVFAAYRPVSKADSSVRFDLAYCVDVLQNLASESNDPVEFYKQMSTADDDKVSWALSYLSYGPIGYVPVTTDADLEQLFPRGVEETDILNTFRRAAIHLALYASKNNGRGTGSDEVIHYAKEQYFLVGYNFEFEYEERVFFFKFVDAVSDEEMAMFATVISWAIPWIDGFYYVRPGVIAATLRNDLTDIVFRTGVRAIESMIYKTIYYTQLFVL